MYWYFTWWHDDGSVERIHDALRGRIWEADGRDVEPSAGLIDSRSVRTADTVPAATRGLEASKKVKGRKRFIVTDTLGLLLAVHVAAASIQDRDGAKRPLLWTRLPDRSQGIDAGKKIVGRKRSIVTDTLGLLLAVLVTAAGVTDSVAGTALLDKVVAEHPRVRKVWVDGGYRQHLVEYAATLGIDMEITVRKPGTRGFTPISKRWAVERPYGWLMLHRRLARDCETLPTRSEAMIHLAMTGLMARRLTRENTISWRDSKKTTEHPISG